MYLSDRTFDSQRHPSIDETDWNDVENFFQLDYENNLSILYHGRNAILKIQSDIKRISKTTVTGQEEKHVGRIIRQKIALYLFYTTWLTRFHETNTRDHDTEHESFCIHVFWVIISS